MGVESTGDKWEGLVGLVFKGTGLSLLLAGSTLGVPGSIGTGEF